jgi:hypothetical protein
MEPIGCLETLVRNYHYSLRNNPEERSSYLLRGESLKSRVYLVYINVRKFLTERLIRISSKSDKPVI